MSTTTIKLDAALDIAHASALKGALDADLSGATALRLDGEQVGRVDAAGLQLLLAFVRQCQTQGLELSWHAPSETLCDGAAGLGLAQALQLQLPNQEA